MITKGEWNIDHRQQRIRQPNLRLPNFDNRLPSLKQGLTANGSACSQLICEPHEAILDDSGRDSGTMNKMKARLKAVMSVARMMTSTSPLLRVSIHVPSAGLITRLAANVAETWREEGGREGGREQGGREGGK